MTDFKQLDLAVDQAILSGQALDAFEKYYADGVVMRENDGEPFVGKDVNRKREQEFFGSVEAFHGAEVVSKGFGDNVSLTEWMFDLTFKGGQRTKMEQVGIRRWKDGQIVSERVYYKGQH